MTPTSPIARMLARFCLVDPAAQVVLVPFELPVPAVPVEPASPVAPLALAWTVLPVCFLAVLLTGCVRSSETSSDRGESIGESIVATQVVNDRQVLFESGVEYADFIENVSRREAMWLRNTAKGEVPEDLTQRVNAIRGKSAPLLHILAVAEDGCSDSANIIPYLAKFADTVEGLDMRIVNSTAGREVMETHRTPDGRAATPTIVVLDADFREVGCLIERPKELQDWALANKEKLSSAEFMKQKFSWYDRDLGKQSMSEIVTVMENAGSELVNCGESK